MSIYFNGRFGFPDAYALNKGVRTQYGPELVVNGGFAGASGWTLSGFQSISGGVLNLSNAGTGSYAARNAGVVVSGKTYQVTFTIVTRTTGDFFVKLGTASGAKHSAPGTYVQNIVAAGTTIEIWSAFAAGNGSIDNVSVKEVFLTENQPAPSLARVKAATLAYSYPAAMASLPTITNQAGMQISNPTVYSPQTCFLRAFARSRWSSGSGYYSGPGYMGAICLSFETDAATIEVLTSAQTQIGLVVDGKLATSSGVS